jgi:hypothetical protein
LLLVVRGREIGTLKGARRAGGGVVLVVAAEVSGSVIRPGALQEGTMVVAMYREENGDKILTKLSLRQSAPAPSTPTEPPKR